MNLNCTPFIKIHPLNSSKAILINLNHIVAIEEIGEEIIRIQTTTHNYETKNTLADIESILTRTSIILNL